MSLKQRVFELRSIVEGGDPDVAAEIQDAIEYVFPIVSSKGFGVFGNSDAALRKSLENMLLNLGYGEGSRLIGRFGSTALERGLESIAKDLSRNGNLDVQTGRILRFVFDDIAKHEKGFFKIDPGYRSVRKAAAAIAFQYILDLIRVINRAAYLANENGDFEQLLSGLKRKYGPKIAGGNLYRFFELSAHN